jgi:multiple sugar transport system substrate-binding protein
MSAMSINKHAIHRRTFLQAVGAGTLALATNHRNTVASRQESVTLNFWNGLTGPDGQIMEQLVEQYLEENPHVTINQQQIQWVDFYTKMFTAIPAGEGPEMAIMHTYEVPRFAGQNLVVPIPTEEIEAVGLDPDDFFEQAWDGGTHEGERYALPVDVHCLGLYLNNEPAC